VVFALGIAATQVQWISMDFNTGTGAGGFTFGIGGSIQIGLNYLRFAVSSVASVTIGISEPLAYYFSTPDCEGTGQSGLFLIAMALLFIALAMFLIIKRTLKDSDRFRTSIEALVVVSACCFVIPIALHGGYCLDTLKRSIFDTIATPKLDAGFGLSVTSFTLLIIILVLNHRAPVASSPAVASSSASSG